MDPIIPKLRRLSPGTVIPKPDAKGEFKVKGWGKRRGQPALVYFIPNHAKPDRPYEKGVNALEWERAYRQLLDSGEFTRKWYDGNMPHCANEGPCNFTTIGGIFSLLGWRSMNAKACIAASSRDAAGQESDYAKIRKRLHEFPMQHTKPDRFTEDPTHRIRGIHRG